MLQLHAIGRWACLAALLSTLGACAPMRLVTPAPPPSVRPAPDPPDPSGVEVVEAAPAPDFRPLPAPQIPLLPEPSPPEEWPVGILYDDSSPEYAEVVRELRNSLQSPPYRITEIDITGKSPAEVLGALERESVVFVVAIGLPAARLARDGFDGPVLFSQVFNYEELLARGRPIRGIAAMPPLELQLREWRRIDPGLKRIGLILSGRYPHLLNQAEYAAETSGVDLRHAMSSNDQETLYLFKRMAPEIDGFWLVPDDRILSPTVIRELLDYAGTHGVRVTVFNDALLEWGAFQSVTAAPDGVARRIRLVLERMMLNGVADVADLTPLSEFEVHINREVAGRLDLEPPDRSSWVVREP